MAEEANNSTVENNEAPLASEGLSLREDIAAKYNAITAQESAEIDSTDTDTEQKSESQATSAVVGRYFGHSD